MSDDPTKLGAEIHDQLPRFFLARSRSGARRRRLQRRRRRRPKGE
jgi:hypothetical protein